MTIAIIVAVGKDGVIGKNGELPWHYASDLKFFKETTMGHPVLMGRVTYQSILKQLGKPLPGRKNIVLTHDVNFKDDRVTVLHELDDIKKLTGPNETLFIIGGAEIYRHTLKHANIVYLTHIDKAVPDGDAHFPTLELDEWRIDSETSGTENGTHLRWCKYVRAAPHIRPPKRSVA